MARPTFARLACLLFLVVGLFGCDHATKLAAKATLEHHAVGVPVAPEVLHGAVELHYVKNEDMAFNALTLLGIPRSPAILIGLSAVAIAAIGAMAIASYRRRKKSSDANVDAKSAVTSNAAAMDHATQAGLALVLGGALGNIVDRVVRGYVVDFIHVKGWPVFNVADIAVVAGMILMALPRLRRRQPAEATAASSPPPPPINEV